MSLSDFQILQKLGDGSYSSVYKVKRLEDGLEYALKKVKISHLSDREKENALNEVRILASIKHKNVASYKQAFFDEPSSSLCIVMEYADNGDVFQKICQYQQTNNLFKEKVIWKIFIQTVRGLKVMHDLKILHRDMKSANIFLYRDYTAKLGDLNVSKVAKKGLLYTQTGTPYYASPEVWKDQPYDCKSDIWSLGCVLYEMCSLVPPFRADDMNGLFKKVLKGAYPQIPSNYSMDMRSIIKSLLQVNPVSRPTTEQILDMPIIVRRIKKYFKDETMNHSVMTTGLNQTDLESELLKTIKFSKNLFQLKLPPSTYDSVQFQTLPSNLNLSSGKALLPQVSRNSNISNNSLSTATAEKSMISLPKITASSRNNNHSIVLTANTHSTKSQPRVLLNQSSIQGVGEELNDDDAYEQENFEYEDKSHLLQQPQQQHQVYNNAPPAQSKSIAKSRSYSGRQQHQQHHSQSQAIQKKIHQQQHQQDHNAANEYADNNNTGGVVQPSSSYAMNSNRSKSTVSYLNNNEMESPSQKNIRGLNQSPSLESTQKKKGSKQIDQIQQQQLQSSVPHQPTPIDEKAELESQYEDDFIQNNPGNGPAQSDEPLSHPLKAPRGTQSNSNIKNSRNNLQSLKSGKRTNNEQSVNTSLQQHANNQDIAMVSMLDRPSKQQQIQIQREPSQHSEGNNSSGVGLKKSILGVVMPKSTTNQQQQQNHMSRSPSDKSLDKSSLNNEHSQQTRSLQPSQLSKNAVILKPQQQQLQQINQTSNQSPQQAQLPQQITIAPKKSPNIDRIVNIYSINSIKAKKKKFYLNMGAQQQQQQQQTTGQTSSSSLGNNNNDDIRVKLRQLREGIGYYDNSSSATKSLNRQGQNHGYQHVHPNHYNHDSSFDHAASSRNINNSSVLLPELKGSLSPASGAPHHLQYQSNNSIMGKKQSFDRILRGVENTQSINRIYRKVFQQQEALSRVGLDNHGVGSTALRSQNVPLKIRAAQNINIYKINNNNNSSSHNNELDVQGRAVINAK